MSCIAIRYLYRVVKSFYIHELLFLLFLVNLGALVSMK